VEKDPAELWSVAPMEERPLRHRDPGSLASGPGDRVSAEAATLELQTRLVELQTRLWAESRRSLLLVLQGIDASGKDGTVSHVFRGLNPLGLRVVAFKEPTRLELAHDFLWRVHAACPAAGEIGIFNRSHYEDVLTVRVHHTVEPKVWRARYAQINAFESLLSDSGTTIVKVFLHISKREQAKRLEARLDDPKKAWKIRQSDLDDRRLWPAYTAAFDEMLQKTSTKTAPWYVIPADHKWFRSWAVTHLVVRAVEKMDPRYPEAAITFPEGGERP
jgi:PPK2 family polyphosphate:nucleotide phosphotransferase